MYFFIKCTYILHLPKSAPLIDIEQFLKHELELLENDFKIAEDTIQTVTFGFFRSLLTSNSSRRHQWEAFLEDMEWRQTTEYKFLQDISFWNQVKFYNIKHNIHIYFSRIHSNLVDRNRFLSIRKNYV